MSVYGPVEGWGKLVRAARRSWLLDEKIFVGNHAWRLKHTRWHRVVLWRRLTEGVVEASACMGVEGWRSPEDFAPGRLWEEPWTLV